MALIMAMASEASDTPTVKLKKGVPISESSATSYYGNGVTHTDGIAAWSGNPPEIVALARFNGLRTPGRGGDIG